MPRSFLPAVPVLVAFLLAGCGSSPGPSPSGGAEEAPHLEATATTGVLRVVVVDSAIRPLAGAAVAVRGGASSQDAKNVTTGADGFAGFEGLEPGAYVVRAAHAGFTTVQQVATVEAGVDDPPVVKLQLEPDLAFAPFYVEQHFQGFMQCGVAGAIGSANVCFIANFYPCYVEQQAGQACTGNLTSDNSFLSLSFVRDYQRAPDHVQVEMVWDSTQALSPEMMVRLDVQNLTDFTIPYANSSAGVSPLFVTLNATVLADYDVGTENDLAVEAFTSSDTAGVTVQQRLDYFVHVFYGYTPPADWRFSSGEPVPLPPT